MNEPAVPEEPLNNIELESTILGMKMALTPEEAAEAREKFLEQLRQSTLVVPTVKPVPTMPDGSIVPNTDITFVVVETEDRGSGVPGFTTLAGLKAALPNVGNGLFLNGAQLASILSTSPHKLFVDGPDMHAEVDNAEMLIVAQAAQVAMEAQQAAAAHNQTLEAALADLATDDSMTVREAVTSAFLGGFCRIPVAGPADTGAKCIMMRTGNPQDPASIQEIPLLTDDEKLLCFTSEEAMRRWQEAERNALALPGPMIADMLAQTGVSGLVINRGAADERIIRLEQKRLVVA